MLTWFYPSLQPGRLYSLTFILLESDLLLLIQKNQRYNISEDTWQQVLAFTWCTRDNLEAYDPEGTILIGVLFTIS